MFVQRGKIGYDEGETKSNKQKPQRNIEHITFNDLWEKLQYAVKNGCSTQTELK